MTKVQLAELEQHLNKCVEIYTELNEICDTARKCGLMDIDGKLHEIIWRTFDAFLETNNPDDWAHWFIYENSGGSGGMQCHKDGKKYNIRNVGDMIKFLAL